ncbi:MAG: OmpA family protein [Bacteroidota bacterium]
MKSIKIIFLTLIVVSSQFCFSQNRFIKNGDKHYFSDNYEKAIKFYELAENKNIETERMLTNCYVYTNQFDKAKAEYEIIIAKPNKSFDDLWNYFSLLLKMGNYDLAMLQLKPMLELKPEDSRIKEYLAAGKYYEKMKSEAALFEIRNLIFNNNSQDFGTSYYKNSIVFASTRAQKTSTKRLWNINELPFLNIFIAQIDSNDELSNPKPFYKELNKKYHDGPISFNKEGTIMAVSINNYNSKSADGVRKQQIFTSELVNNEWTVLKSFPYNNSEYSTGQACLSFDGKFMYFASDMPGGKGGIDIFKVERRADGTWGKLINLEAINTEGDEMFPYINKNGVLFFASNGHVGLGGLDLFMAALYNDKVGVARNLGSSINSLNDDFALLLNDDLQKGYFSSNRKDGKGSDDLYAVKCLNSANILAIIAADIKQLEEDEKNASKPTYIVKEIVVTKDAESNSVKDEVKKNEEVTENRVLDATKTKQSDDAPKTIIVENLKKYEPIKHDIVQEQKTVDVATKTAKGSSFGVGDIQFFDSTEILTPASIEKLRGVVRVLVENPTMMLEIGVHLDNGNTSLKTSQIRADAIMRFLTENGANSSQLKAIGYGKTKPLTPATGHKARDINRRVEFKVIKK